MTETMVRTIVSGVIFLAIIAAIVTVIYFISRN
jgi:hypothetical protein